MNQQHPNSKRIVFLMHEDDKAALENFATKTGLTISILMREAAQRLVTDIENNNVTLSVRAKEEKANPSEPIKKIPRRNQK